MRKFLCPVLFLFFICSVIRAQTPAPTSDAAQQAVYSESAPYKPRELKIKQKPQSKKEKKSKKDSPAQKQVAPPVAVEPNTAVENPVESENYSIGIPVSVFDANGNAVRNLVKSDFKIYVDGEEKEITDFSQSEQPLNLILILDTSPSAAFEIEDMRRYATNIVNLLRPHEKAMIVKFDERAEVLAELTDDRQKISAAIKKAEIGDGTSLYETVKYSLQKRISQIPGRKLVVLLTDGVDTTSRAATFEDSLKEAEKSDAAFFPVYLNTYQHLGKSIPSRRRQPPFNDQILQQILSQIPRTPNRTVSMEEEYELGRQYLDDLAWLSGGRTIAVKNLSDVKQTGFETLFEALRNETRIGVSFPGKGKTEQRIQIKVRVNRPNSFVQARGSYVVGEKK